MEHGNRITRKNDSEILPKGQTGGEGQRWDNG